MSMWPRGGSCTTTVGVFLLLCLLVEVVYCEDDLYRVLGVSRSASAKEIRSAHKRMAKEWHPDKNKSPEAQEKIMQINRAYEVLSDDEKRQRYDLTGETGETPQARGPAHGHTVFTFHNGRSFHFFTGGGSPHRSDAINTPTFFNDILPNSHHKPYLLTFHHEFCMQCVQLEQVWKELHNELSQLGVGVGSVHSTMQPRIASHCGATRVPAVVGVVSGRVVHYYGRWGGASSTYRTFLENILPNTITDLSGSSDPDDFLSQAVARNRPRVILFTQREKPSLLYKLTAFAHKQSLDFGYVSTDPVHLSRAVSQRFEVLPRERRLLVFKEYASEPALSIEATQLSGDKLRSLVEGLSLHLPRLSSPLWLDRVCPPGRNRVCLLLLVDGPSAYTDDVTNFFRGLAKDVTMRAGQVEVGWAYVDTGKQSNFVQSFGPLPTDLKLCPDGNLARPVIAIKRVSSQNFVFDWFVDFCGLEDDTPTLHSFAATQKLRRSGVLRELVDEEAPGRFGRMWMKVTQFFYDLSDFISAVDSHMMTPLVSLSVTALLICLVGALSGTSDDTSNSSSKRNGKQSQHRSSPSGRDDVIYKLSQNKYSDFISHAPKGLVTLVVFIDSYKQEESKNLIHSFWRIAERFLSHRTRVCYICYKSHGTWLGRVLQQSGELKPREIDARVGGCLSGEVVTILAVFGAKKRFCVFPDSLRDRSSSPEVPNGSANHSHHTTASPGSNYPAESQQRVDHMSVGQVLGSAFGFDAEDSESCAVNTTSIRTQSETDSDYSSRVTSTLLQPSASTDSVSSRPGSSEATSQSDAKDLRHSAASHSGVGDQTEHFSDRRAETQLAEKLDMWMERLVDGSVKRYSVDYWPKWS